MTLDAAKAGVALFLCVIVQSSILSLVDVRNVTIERVQVQVWSGLANPSVLDYILAYRYLLIGVLMLAVVLVFRRL